jgi:LacI family transcriptional regulator
MTIYLSESFWKLNLVIYYLDICRARNLDGAIIFGLRVQYPYLHEIEVLIDFLSVLIDIPLSGAILGHVTMNKVHGAVIAVEHLLD